LWSYPKCFILDLATFDDSLNLAIVFTRKNKRNLRGLKIDVSMIYKGLAFLFILILPNLSYSQCAMCRAVVEQGGEEVAEGINSGIVYLMAFPYILVATAFYLFYRNWKKSNLK